MHAYIEIDWLRPNWKQSFSTQLKPYIRVYISIWCYIQIYIYEQYMNFAKYSVRACDIFTRRRAHNMRSRAHYINQHWNKCIFFTTLSLYFFLSLARHTLYSTCAYTIEYLCIQNKKKKNNNQNFHILNKKKSLLVIKLISNLSPPHILISLVSMLSIYACVYEFSVI